MSEQTEVEPTTFELLEAQRVKTEIAMERFKAVRMLFYEFLADPNFPEDYKIKIRLFTGEGIG